jgi:hypothetical protein
VIGEILSFVAWPLGIKFHLQEDQVRGLDLLVTWGFFIFLPGAVRMAI